MSKIYVFGIGGTGVRILRALTMLLAAGVECQADAIVPIIIDPDAAAGDVERAVDLMKKYGEIRSKLNFDSKRANRFFKTDIKEIMTNFRLPLSNTQDVLFDEYMNVSEMSRENQALVNMLFSQKNLASDMTVGFKGNPNVGSVVLNQFDDSYEFQNFANEFTEQDKIFIISSIFGGTGASGFPLLLKTLRTSEDVANKNYVHNAHIGAITVLPYFQVKQDENSQIDSATFVSKAKSALAYYERNISKNNSIDTLYYIADDIRTTYDNYEGGTNQKNDAHFVEMVSALALIDFANSQKPERTVHKEFGIEIDTKEIIFENIGNITKGKLRQAMTQFHLFSKYLGETDESDFLKLPWTKIRSLDKTFFDGDFIKTLKKIQDEYLTWLEEMTLQERAFTPLYLHKDSKKVFDLVKGVKPKRLWWIFDSNYNLFDNRLNGQKGESSTGTKEQQFVELFYLATKQLVREKFNIV
jgi:transcriptional regulator with XRE-family HTH domain